MELPIGERLRHTTEEMAQRASVDMQLWDKHSNACLSSADLITELVAALERAKTGIAVLGDVNKHLGLQMGQDRASDMMDEINALLVRARSKGGE